MIGILIATAALQADWFKANAVPLVKSSKFDDTSDLAKLAPLVQNARIVGMGEATHGTREFFETKHRMFRYLVQNHGFRVFILEASMAGCLKMDAYVLGKPVDVKEAIYEQQFWTWSVVELRELLEWMREYNKTHEEKLRVFGNDMQNTEDPMVALDRYESRLKDLPSGGPDQSREQKWESWLPLIKAQLGEDEYETASLILDTYRQAEGLEWTQVMMRWQQRVVPQMPKIFPDAEKLLAEIPDLDETSRAALKFVDDHKSKLIPEDETRGEGINRLKTRLAALKALREKHASNAPLAERIRLQTELFEFLLVASTMPKSVTSIADYRDACMAKNTSTIIEKVVPNAKAMIWAHNGHIGRNQIQRGYAMMGWHINSAWKEKYVPLGFAFSEGSFRAISDGKLKVVKLGPSKAPLDVFLEKAFPYDFFVPTRNQESLPKELSKPMQSRQIGALFDEEDEAIYDMRIDARSSFDGIFFFRKTSAARPLD